MILLLYITLFLTFFEIGLFGFGGGYGMLSLIQSQVVTHHQWMTSGQFADIVAISQITPGPIGINSATYCGYTAIQNAGGNELMCILGSSVATFALVLPSFILMLLIAMFFMKFKENATVKSVFTTIRPVVVGLIAAACLMLMTEENFSTPSNLKEFLCSILLFAATFIGIRYFKISTIRMLIICGIAGLILFL